MDKDLVILWLFVLSLAMVFFGFSEPDYTDSGVGCVDDCLEPMKGASHE